VTGQIDLKNLRHGQLRVSINGPEVPLSLLVGRESLFDCTIDRQAVTASAYVASGIIQQLLESEVYSIPSQQQIDFSDPIALNIGGQDSFLMSATDIDRDILVITVDMGEGIVIPVIAFAPLGEMEQYEATLLAVVETFEYTPNPDWCTQNISP
jgi:hypothetical protein